MSASRSPDRAREDALLNDVLRALGQQLDAATAAPLDDHTVDELVLAAKAELHRLMMAAGDRDANPTSHLGVSVLAELIKRARSPQVAPPPPLVDVRR
jgi:hypothetical protein